MPLPISPRSPTNAGGSISVACRIAPTKGKKTFMSDSERFADRMLLPGLARVSEAAAIAAAPVIGCGDGKFGLTAQGIAASGRRALARAAQ